MISNVSIIISAIGEICAFLAFCGISPETLGIDTYNLLKYIIAFLCVFFGTIIGWNLRIKYEEKYGSICEMISDLKEAPYEVKVNIARAYINGYFIEEDPEESSYSAIAYSAIGAMGYAKPSTDKYLEFCVKVSTRDGYRYELKPEIRRIIKKNQDIIEDAKNDI